MLSLSLQLFLQKLRQLPDVLLHLGHGRQVPVQRPAADAPGAGNMCFGDVGELVSAEVEGCDPGRFAGVLVTLAVCRPAGCASGGHSVTLFSEMESPPQMHRAHSISVRGIGRYVDDDTICAPIRDSRLKAMR